MFKTAAESFYLFLSIENIEKMTHYTNLYAVDYTQRLGRKRPWKPVTVNEMKAFIGLLIAAGRNGQNHTSTKQLWSSNEFWTPPFYRTVMGRTRFEEIFVCWRFDDKSTRKERFLRSGDKLEPVREIYDEIVKACIENYSPSENLTVDERLALFKGMYFL